MTLTELQIADALPRVAVGLNKYIWLQAQFLKRDVARDTEYQRRFAGFYRVRRNATWRNAYFKILERAKFETISFKDALKAIHAETGRCEASFASKLAATVDPTQPVIDSVVLDNLGLQLPSPTAPERFSLIENLHVRLANLYDEYLASESARSLVEQFRTTYPEANVTQVKMVDFVLWQIRSK